MIVLVGVLFLRRADPVADRGAPRIARQKETPSMPDVCGSRRGYQAGCKCTKCRAANALYAAEYRQQKRTGTAPLGSLVPARRTHIVMKALRSEMTRSQLEVRLGWCRHYARIQQAPRITLRTALKIQIVWHESRLKGPALPTDQQQIVLDTLHDLGRS